MQSEVDLALGRFAEYMRKADSLAVSLEASTSASPARGTGTLTYTRPERLAFTMKGPGVDYTWIVTEVGGVEIDRSSRKYDEMPRIGGLNVPMSRLSEVPSNTFPVPIILGDLRAILPDTASYKLAGKQDIGGVSAEQLVSEFQTMVGRARVDAYLAPDGRLLRLSLTTSQGAGSFTRTLDLKGYKTNQPVSPSVFDLAIPSGFVPHALPKVERNTNVGFRPPLKGWKRDGAEVDLRRMAAGKPMLLIVTAPDCEVSARAAKALDELAASSEKGGAAVLRLYTEPTNRSEDIVDPDGRATLDLGIPGTPTIYLLDRTGEVSRMWYGYDAGEWANRRKDMQDALRSL